MKKLAYLIPIGLILSITAGGQQKKGRVVYQRTMQMQTFTQQSGQGGFTQQSGQMMMPPPLAASQNDKIEVLFGNNHSLCRTIDNEMPDPNISQGGYRIHTMVAGTDDVTYADFVTDRLFTQRELGTKNYVVSDSIKKLNWKLTGNTTTILNYPCQQAVTYQIEKHPMVIMKNGKMRSHEVTDTVPIAVWFTLSVPVPAGPQYAGQLPGLILGVDINRGKIVYKAISVSDKVDMATIKIPSRGKKITGEEFAAKNAKLMKEIRRYGTERGTDIHFDP